MHSRLRGGNFVIVISVRQAMETEQFNKTYPIFKIVRLRHLKFVNEAFYGQIFY